MLWASRRRHLQLGDGPALWASRRLPVVSPSSSLARAQVADYFIRWWTRDEYRKYGAACTGDCGGIFYVRWCVAGPLPS